MYAASERDTYEQVMERDGRRCLICGTRDRPTLHHLLPRGAGGTVFPIDPRLGIVACGSGTTGCHGLVENMGRRDGWAYELGYLTRHGHALSMLRDDPDSTWLVWGHADRVWWELTRGGVRTALGSRPAPAPLVLAALDAALGTAA